MKSEILAVIGENALGRAAQVNAALAANDRIKYYLSLLQMAMARADRPEQPSTTLRRERLASSIDDPALDEVVSASRREGESYRIPGCAKVLQAVTQELRIMAAPVVAEHGPFAQRLEVLLGRLPALSDGLIPGDAIQEIARAGDAKRDSIHQFVMDVHKR